VDSMAHQTSLVLFNWNRKQKQLTLSKLKRMEKMAARVTMCTAI